MQLDLRGRAAAQKFSREAIEFSGTLDLSHLTRWGEKPFSEPVRISGSAVYNGDFFELAYGAEFNLHTVCARCLKPLVLADRLEFSHIVMEANESSEHWEDIVPLHDGMLDLDGMVSSDLLLELEGAPLCTSDCRGLCPKCGRSLNEADCGCDLSEPDPRFDALRKLIEQDRPESEPKR